MLARCLPLLVGAVILATTACADSTAPSNDCPVTTGGYGCTGH